MLDSAEEANFDEKIKQPLSSSKFLPSSFLSQVSKLGLI